MLDSSFPACAFFFLSLFLSFLKRKLACSHLFHSLCKDQSTVAQQVTLCPGGGKVSPFKLGWVEGVCVFRCNLPPALLAQ